MFELICKWVGVGLSVAVLFAFQGLFLWAFVGVWFSPASPTNFARVHGLFLDDEASALVSSRLKRRRRSRWIGYLAPVAVGGLLVGLFDAPSEAGLIGVPLLQAATMIGVVLGELVASRARPTHATVRAASLRRRDRREYLPSAYLVALGVAVAVLVATVVVQVATNDLWTPWSWVCFACGTGVIGLVPIFFKVIDDQVMAARPVEGSVLHAAEEALRGVTIRSLAASLVGLVCLGIAMVSLSPIVANEEFRAHHSTETIVEFVDGVPTYRSVEDPRMDLKHPEWMSVSWGAMLAAMGFMGYSGFMPARAFRRATVIPSVA